MGFIPSKELNRSENELARALRHTGREAQFVSFKIPRRFGPMQGVVDMPELEPITYEVWESSASETSRKSPYGSPR